MTLDCDFPAGNILLERIEGDDVYLRQDPRDTSIWWFWWYFRVRGAGGRRLRLHFTDGDVLGVRGPAVSEDGGETWRWLGTDCVAEDGFSHEFAGSTTEVRFAFAFPYTGVNLRQFLGGA